MVVKLTWLKKLRTISKMVIILCERIVKIFLIIFLKVIKNVFLRMLDITIWLIIFQSFIWILLMITHILMFFQFLNPVNQNSYEFNDWRRLPKSLEFVDSERENNYFAVFFWINLFLMKGYNSLMHLFCSLNQKPR